MQGYAWLEGLAVLAEVPTYLLVALAVSVAILLVRLAEKRFIARWKRRAAATPGTLDDVIVDVLDRSLLPLIYFGLFALGIVYLDLPAWVARTVQLVGVALIAFYGARVSTTVLAHAVNRGPAKGDVNRVRVAVPIIQVAVWGLALVFLLDNLGVQIGAVIAGLGIGGIAVALAAQAILGDLFSYVAIVFDRPFSIGDYIVVDAFSGTVEHIGIKTTRVRSSTGELIVFGNSNLLAARLRNFRSMYRRRVLFTFGVAYQTSTDTLEKIPDLVRALVRGMPSVTLDRVHLQALGPASVDFEVVYYVENPEYHFFMDVQQTINLQLKRSLEKLGAEFAAPARPSTPAAPTTSIEPTPGPATVRSDPR
jgi:small-conductance mechanosensitive channel